MWSLDWLLDLTSLLGIPITFNTSSNITLSIISRIGVAMNTEVVGARGGVVTKALRCKSEGRGFEIRCVNNFYQFI